MRFSIIILNYNGFRFLTRCLESVLTSDYPSDQYEVILVDNGSTDGSLELVRAQYPKVRVLENKANLGFAKGNNVGASVAHGQYLVFLNNDTKCSSDWLTKFSDGIEAFPAAIYTGRLMMPNGRINSAGGICDTYGFACDRGIFEPDSGQYSEMEQVFFGCGALLVVQRDLWNELRGFDERYFIYYEDCDLCWRGRLQGFPTIYLPNVVVYHEYGATIPGASPLRYFLRERNRLSTMIKNLEMTTLVLVAPRYLAFKLAEIFGMILTRNFSIASSVLRALTWNIVNLRTTYRARRLVQSQRVVRDTEILRTMAKDSIELARLRQGFLRSLRRA